MNIDLISTAFADARKQMFPEHMHVADFLAATVADSLAPCYLFDRAEFLTACGVTNRRLLRSASVEHVRNIPQSAVEVAR